MPHPQPEAERRREAPARQAIRDLARRHVLTAWVGLILILGVPVAPRFWPAIRSLLAQPAMCSSEPSFDQLVATVAETRTVLLVTDRSPERSGETLFCAQSDLIPRPVVRHFTNTFDPTWSPAEPVLFVVDNPDLLAALVARRTEAVAREGGIPSVVRESGNRLLFTMGPARP